MEQIKVMLVEDHTLFREGTKGLIEEDPAIHVVGETDTAEEAIRMAEELSPDVLLVDIRLRTGTGIEVARALQKKQPPIRVLVLTAYDFEQYVTALTRAGVSGYMLKDVSSDDLIKAIHQVCEGQGVLSGSIAQTVLQSLSKGRRETARPSEALTIREIEVLELVMQSYRNPMISARLGISTRTVEAHVANILGKLGAASRNEAVRIAIELGYLKSQEP